MKDLVVYQSKVRLILFIFLAIIMLATSIFALYAVIEIPNIGVQLVYTFVLVTGILLFGLGSIYLTRQIIIEKKLVILKEEGFIDASSATANPKLIGWERVKEINMIKISGQNFITLHLFDGNVYIETLSKPQRFAVKANLKLGAGHVTLNVQTAKGIKMEELYEIMLTY